MFEGGLAAEGGGFVEGFGVGEVGLAGVAEVGGGGEEVGVAFVEVEEGGEWGGG